MKPTIPFISSLHRTAWLATSALGLLTSPAALRAEDATSPLPPETGPRLTLTEPREGTTLTAPAALDVRAVGLGRLGGITDVELLLDDRSVGESHIRFIRAPDPNEPVHHEFHLDGLGAGHHTLVARELGDAEVKSAPVSFSVIEKPKDPTGEPVESLRILSPQPGAMFRFGEALAVEAVGVGRFGGITHVELLLDGVVSAESQIVFIRAPEADEPVHHSFQLETPPPVGSHRLRVREVGNPQLESSVVPIEVLDSSLPASRPLLRLSTLQDGTLVLILSGEESPSDVEIQSSSDLVTWESVGPAWPALRNPVLKATDVRSLATGTARYYRAVSAAAAAAATATAP